MHTRSRFIIGLTGGIGSGKSEVSNRLESRGIQVVDADIVARQVVEPGTPALDLICQHFGANLVDSEGQLQRAQLRQIIFSNINEKQWLENLLHPIIRKTIITQLNQTSSLYAVLSSPLLLETDQHKLVNRILVIDASEDLQLQRASQRDNNSLEQIHRIMKSQMNRQQRCAAADDIIYNQGDLRDLENQVEKLHQIYLKMAEDFV